MTEQGTVLSVKNGYANVRIGRNSACASCGKCGMTERQKYVDFYAVNSVNAKEGDVVVLEIPETNSAKFAFVGYFLPIIPALGLLALALGLQWEVWIAALMFLAGLVIGFCIVALVEKLRRHKWIETPQIVEIVPRRREKDVQAAENGETDGAEQSESDDVADFAEQENKK